MMSPAAPSPPVATTPDAGGALARTPVYVPAADTFRAFAMLLVMTLHCVIVVPQWAHEPPEAPALFLGGELAVPFFFVLSGFVLSVGVARRGALGSLREYFERRAVRIFPAYWLMLGALLLSWPFLFEAPSPMTTKDGILGVLVHLPMLQFMLLGEQGFVETFGFGVNPVVWSLTNEVVFYLVFPFVVPVFLRRPGAALAASLAASLLWRAGATNLQGLASLASVDVPEWLPRHLFRQAPAYAFTFAAGMYAATVHAGRAGHPFFSSRRALALHGLSAAVVLGGLHVAGKGAALAASPVYQDYLRDLVPSAAFALWLTLASNAAPAIRGAYETSVGRFLGHVAYGVFLWHMPVMHVVWALVEPGELGLTRGTWTVVALVVPVSILSGWLSYRFLEQPLLRFLAWRQRERRRARKDAQEAPLVPRPAAG